jgi:hypothetical protein
MISQPVPKAGEILLLDRSASVQFTQPILFRVIRVHEDWITYDAWLWLDGYQLDQRYEAVGRRSVFVQIKGLRRVRAPEPRRRPAPRGNRG